VVDRRPVTWTTGEFFPDGRCIELLRDPKSGRATLLSYDGANSTIAPRVKTRGNVYLPAVLEPSFLRAITLPSPCTDFGSTLELFTAVRAPFTTYGFTEEAALPAAYFIFSTWFPDCLPAAPYLAITGPKPEAGLLLRLFECMVRHALLLADVTRSALCSLPVDLQLTLLIDDGPTSRSVRSLLAASNDRRVFISWKGKLINLFCAKAAYCGLALNDGNVDGTVLHINVPPSRGRLPILDANAQREITEKLQPKMQAYRCRNISRVRESRFDLAGLSSGSRILSRILGACIVDAPELQAGLETILQGQEEHSKAGCWTDLRCVAIEAMLYLGHVETERKIYVGKAAGTASTILRGRGETTPLSPEKFGGVLRFLGLTPQRDKKGFAIVLTDRVRRRIHELARDYDVPAVQERVARCPLCSEILSVAGPRVQGNSGSRKRTTPLG